MTWVHIWEEPDPPKTGFILGVTKKGHDSSAALIDPRTKSVVAFCQEERITRVKHERRFPIASIQAVMREGNATTEDLAAIAVGHGLRWYDSLPGESVSPAEFESRVVPATFVKKDLRVRNSFEAFKNDLRGALGLGAEPTLPPIFCVRHHLAHVFAARTCAEEGNHPILVADGRGEWDTITLWESRATRVDLLRRVSMPLSLGYFYNVFGDFFGWRTYGFEGRLMGLAPYGRPRNQSEEATLALCEEFLCDALPDAADFPFFSTNTAILHGGYSAERIEEYARRNWWLSPFVLAPRARARLLKLATPLPGDAALDPDNEHHRALCILAYAIQRRLSTVWIRLCRHALGNATDTPLLLCGGVALNAVANGEVSELLARRQNRLVIPPYATDEGLSVGAANAIAWLLYDKAATITTAQIGHDAATEDVRAELIHYGIDDVDPLPYETCLERAANSLRRGESVAVFGDREEAGPRALGARSILLPADRPMSFDTGNTAKARERWRPLALAVLEEHAAQLFEPASATPYMNVCLRSRAGTRTRFMSGLHPADGTTRIQLVTRASAPFLYGVLRLLERSEIYAVINTSFNRKEPIVRRAREALDTFAMLTGIDHLLLGQFWIESKSYAPGLLSVDCSVNIRQALEVLDDDFEDAIDRLAQCGVRSHQARVQIRCGSGITTIPALKEFYDARFRGVFCREVNARGWRIVAECSDYPALQQAFERDVAS